MSMFEIIPGLNLGNYSSAKENMDDVDMIVNCTIDLPFTKPSRRRVNLRLPVDDDGEPSTMDAFVALVPPILEEIHTEVSNGRIVLCHCLAGQQRSCGVVAAYLMKYHGMGVEEAIAYVRNKKPDAFHWDANFRPALVRLAQTQQMD